MRLPSHWLLPVVLLVVGGIMTSTARAQSKDRPSSVFQKAAPLDLYETDGYMVGGDYWDTVKPLNSADGQLTGGLGEVEQVMLFGTTQGLRDPNGLWPSGYPFTQTFRNSHTITFPVFKADGWPGYTTGNPVYDADNTQDTGGAASTSRYMFAAYSPDVAGADDESRNYTRPARYTDETRTHLVYESGFPTTAGIDVRVRAHQFTLNEQNLNDFIALEITMVNTGEPDTDADGQVDASGVTVDGVAVDVGATPSPSIRINQGGGRGGNGFEGASRVFGYVAAPDETRSPYNIFSYHRNVPAVESQTAPPEGERPFGVNFWPTHEGYTDIWNGWQFVGAKQGAVPASDTRSSGSYPSSITASSPDKLTTFGTHPVGEGERKGWYTSSHWRGQLGAIDASDLAFWSATATWYEDYGKTSTGRPEIDLSPNSNFFSGGDAGDITTFQVGDDGARPNGDAKYASEELQGGVTQPIWEEEWNPEVSSNNFFGAIGYAHHYTFGEWVGQGAGPFTLEPGEEMTLVWVGFAGYRLEGLIDAARAASWAWASGWDIRGDLPAPATPDVAVESTPQESALISWTDVDGLGGTSVDGYKVWRAAQYKQTSYTDEGMRLMDRYHHQHEVEGDREGLKDPVNTFFSPGEDFFAGEAQGQYQPAEWGDYELIAKIPAGQLGQYTASGGAYDYAYEDESAITGFTYWYYVSAYTEGNFTGPQGPVEANHLETSNMNRNGRNAPDAAAGEIGLGAQWVGTYPWSVNSADFPAVGTTEHQNLGTSFTLVPPTASVDEVAENITVTPNPYKITGLNDVRNDPSSHAVYFLNLPADFTLTIMDVSGQIIYSDRVEGAPDGQYEWNMFSKDGVEVASGLYIYHVEYSGREVVGHLAILR